MYVCMYATGGGNNNFLTNSFAGLGSNSSCSILNSSVTAGQKRVRESTLSGVC